MDDEKIMMYPGDGLFGEPFDATRWFASGMYRRNLYQDGRPGFDDVGMTRIAPPPFLDTQLEHLRIRITMALDEPDRDLRPVPASAIERVMDPGFDPRPQIIYMGSGFDAPDKPVDGYSFYMLHEGKRYIASLDRDPVDGQIVSSRRVISLGAREERLFRELEEREKLTTWRNASGLRARSGEPCPHPGTWECLDCTPGPQNQKYFVHEAVLPQVDGRDVTWRMVRPYR